MFNAKILKFYVEGENSSHCSSKLANTYISANKKVGLVAADTFRAAATEQI